MPLTLCCIRILSGQDRIFVLSFAYNLLNHIPYSNPPRQNHGAEHQTRKHDHDLKSRLVAEVTMNGDAVKLRGREDIGTRRILSFFGTAGLSKLRSSSWSDLSAQVVHTHTHTSIVTFRMAGLATQRLRRLVEDRPSSCLAHGCSGARAGLERADAEPVAGSWNALAGFSGEIKVLCRKSDLAGAKDGLRSNNQRFPWEHQQINPLGIWLWLALQSQNSFLATGWFWVVKALFS